MWRRKTKLLPCWQRVDFSIILEIIWSSKVKRILQDSTAFWCFEAEINFNVILFTPQIETLFKRITKSKPCIIKWKVILTFYSWFNFIRFLFISFEHFVEFYLSLLLILIQMLLVVLLFYFTVFFCWINEAQQFVYVICLS